MRRTTRWITAIAVLVVGVLPLAGCTAQQPASGSESGRLDAVAHGAAARTESYTEDEARLNRAERVLTRRCMSGRGLPYSDPQVATVAAHDDEWHPDLESRRRMGYGLFDGYAPGAERSPQSESDREVERWPTDRQAAYERALMGTDGERGWIDLRGGMRFTFPTDGCIAESRGRLYGSPHTAARIFYVLQDIARRIDHEVRADPAYAQALLDWSGCMERRGYDHVSPSRAKAELGDAYQRVGATPEMRRLEIETAVADATCATDTGLPAVGAALASRHAEMLTTDDRDDLRRLSASRAAAVHRATAVLRNEGGSR